jgi:DNA helicase-2/ATP-dependent DNA helicase PcrA
MHIQKIFGPPGTGKTTCLLNHVEEELANGTDSTRIGYFAFARKAATEAKERAIQKFPHLNAEKNFPWFRTLHSMAYRCLGLSSTAMMQASNYTEFAKTFGLTLVAEEQEDFMVSTDNVVLNAINLARIKDLSLFEHYHQSSLPFEWHYIDYIARGYETYKKERGLYDFTDLLEVILIKKEKLPNLDVLIVDECQDLSKLQWELVQALSEKSLRVFLAGDDDQAIYNWAGADVDSFLTFPGEVHVLSTSYRVPAKVHLLANKIAQRIRNRQPKQWVSRQEHGEINTHKQFQDVDVTTGEWLILASCNYMLHDVHGWLKAQGLLFERFGQRSIAENLLGAVLGWENLRKGRSVSLSIVKNIYQYLPASAIQRGMKTLPDAEEKESYTMELLKKRWGLNPDVAQLIWHEALSKIPLEKREYIIALLRRGTKLLEKPKIRLSTIHGAKGTEADHVMLLTDLSTKYTQQLYKNPDDIHRLLYVGLTRTRKTLELILPQHYSRSFQF